MACTTGLRHRTALPSATSTPRLRSVQRFHNTHVVIPMCVVLVLIAASCAEPHKGKVVVECRGICLHLREDSTATGYFPVNPSSRICTVAKTGLLQQLPYAIIQAY